MAPHAKRKVDLHFEVLHRPTHVALDFFDAYYIAHNIEPLEDSIKRLKKQYPSVAHDYHHILKSLVYFDDASWIRILISISVRVGAT